jgi:hypothetical protein
VSKNFKALPKEYSSVKAKPNWDLAVPRPVLLLAAQIPKRSTELNYLWVETSKRINKCCI